MTGPLRVVLVGAGTRSRALYLPWLSGRLTIPEASARAVAVLDTDADARSAAADLTGARACEPRELDRVLAEDRPDLVVIATPDAHHHEYARQALTAGCHTLVEKPLATTISDAFGLTRTAQTCDARLLVGHNLRFTNLHTEVRRLIVQGRIGTVLRAEFHYTLNASHAHSYFTRWHRTRAASGGLEITKATHHLDLLTWWLHARPVAVSAQLDRRHYPPGAPDIPSDTDIHDEIHAEITFDSGAVAHYELTVNAPRDGYTCTLHGMTGTLTIRYDARSGPHTMHVQHDGHRETRPITVAREPGTHAGADRRMLAALPAALTGDPTPGFATATDAALAVATGAAMHASSTSNRPVSVPHPTTAGATT